MTVFPTAAQSTTLDTTYFVNNSNIYIDCDTSAEGYIFDDGGPNGDYSNLFSGNIILYYTPGDTLEVWMTVDLDSVYHYYDYLDIYDGDSWNTFYQDTTVHLLCTYYLFQMYFHSDETLNSPGVSIHYRVRPSSCNIGVSDIHISTLSSESIYFSWSSSYYSGPYVFTYNGVDTVVNYPHCQLDHLSRNTLYNCSVVSVADSASSQCYKSCSLTTRRCDDSVYNVSLINSTDSSLTIVWESNRSSGALFHVTIGSFSDTTSARNYTFTGLSPFTTYSITVCNITDTCCPDCIRTLSALTDCYPAKVSGIRPLIGHDTVILTADYADGYLWSTGATTRSIQVFQPGFYTLYAYTDGGCVDSLVVGVSNVELDIDVSVPDHLCPGESTNVHVGLSSVANVRVNSINQASLSDPTRIFLPDGVNCNPSSDHGCSYRSELDFEGFGNYQLMTDANDIRYVMLDIEHSYVGDIYINITCPNGQNADIIRYGGLGSSNCLSEITADHRGWSPGNNCTGCYFGLPVDTEDSFAPCDSTSAQNIAGTGWRYCWSNSFDAGYTYASGDGILYRYDHTTYYTDFGNVYDSSNVAAGTNFYHPDQSFESLVGCPMNGTWYIEVIDGWGADNGYIFGWELALNPDRLSRNLYQPTVAYSDLIGLYSSRTSDTTFTITCPPNLAHDTTITYTVHIYDTAGNLFDTSFSVTFHPPFTRTFDDTIVQNQLPYTIYDTTFTTEVSNVVLYVPNEGSCDSIITYSLHVIPNGYSAHDTTICDDALPLSWHGRTFTAAGTQSFTVTTSYGSDSTVTLNVYVNPTYSLSFAQTICSNQSYTFEGTTYTTSGSYAYNLTTADGCDSVRILTLTVNPVSVVDTLVNVCDQFTISGTTYTSSDTVTLANLGTNVYGCDSSLTLYLTIRHSSDSAISAEACDSFYWYGQWLTATTDSILTHYLTNSVGCDSTVRLVKLDVYPTVNYNDSDTICASDLVGGYTWRDTTLYSTTGGYFTYTRQDNHGCDSIFSLNLSVIPTAYSSVYDTIVQNQAATHTYNGISVPHDTVMTVVIPRATGCDSVVTYHLKVWPNVYSSFDSSICASLWNYFSWHGLSAAETLSVTLTNVHGADSVVTLHLHSLPVYYLSIYDTICSNQTYTFEGNTYSTTGVFHHLLTTVAGCDSTRSLHLVVNNTSVFDTFVTVCDSFTFFGNTYTASALDTISGLYTNTVGCDSSLALHLTVNHSTSAVYNDTCAENYLPRQYIHIISYSDTSNAALVIPNAVGCDSVITYNLHVWRNDSVTLDSTICGNQLSTFTWNGQSPHNSSHIGYQPDASIGSYFDTLHATIPTVHGADSVITMRLLIRPSYVHQFYDTICDNQSALFVDSTYILAGDYTHTLTATNGCDSVVTLHLAVNPTYTFDFYDTVYLGDTVFFEGNAYNEPGVYPVVYASQQGCDSTLVLNLTGKNIVSKSLSDSLCRGDSIFFMGRYLSDVGVYYDTIFTGDFYLGDTVVEFTLTVLDPPQVSIDTSHVCEPDPLYFLEGNADVPYYLWSCIPYDAALDGHENDTLIQVSPTDSSWYFLYVDYREEPLCPATDSVLLAPLYRVTPAIELSPVSITLDDRVVTAYNRSSGRVTRLMWWLWYDGVQAFTSTDPVLTIEVPAYVDSVQITLQVWSQTCSYVTTVDVPIRRSGILFPNVFTPTQDINNIFTGVGKGVIEYEIWIYDRRGDIVYHGTDIRNGWDGTKDGNPCPQGVYVYYCRYTDQFIPNGTQTTKGTVTLLR